MKQQEAYIGRGELHKCGESVLEKGPIQNKVTLSSAEAPASFMWLFQGRTLQMCWHVHL